MFPLLGHQQNTPPAPPLIARQRVVFSLQRDGAKAVFSYQFPVTATVGVTPPPPPAPPPLTGGGGGYSSRRYDRIQRDRSEAQFAELNELLMRTQQERNEAELAEVAELLMALAAAGVLD